MKLNEIEFGNAYELIKTIPDKSIDLVITDPPYELDHLKGGGMLKEKRLIDMMSDLETNKLNVGVNKDLFNELLRVMKKVNIYIWCNKKMIPKLFDFFVKEKGYLFDIIVWNKPNAIPLCGSKYLTDCEYCLYFHETLKLNTTYDTAKTIYQIPINIQDKKLYKHPTIKPLEIIKNLVINSSNENEIVLDPFMGSGTTAVACKELGRNFVGFEINKKYYDIACDRLKGITQIEKQAGIEQIKLF